MAISEDVSTPAIVQRAAGTSGTASTASFTPPNFSLVVVMLVWMWAPNSQPAGITCSDSSVGAYTRIIGNDWLRAGGVYHQPKGGAGTSSAIFTHYYTTSPGPITVTVNSSSTKKASVYLAVRVLLGANPTQTAAGMAHTGMAGDIMTDVTTAGAWAYCCGGRPGQATPVPGPNTTTIASWQDSGSNATAAVGKFLVNTHRGVHRVGWIQHISEVSVLEVVPTALPSPPQWDMDSFEVMTADLMNNWLTPDNQFKGGPTSISSSTVLTADPDLTMPLQTNAYYIWRCVLCTSGTAIRHNWAYPAGTTAGYLLRRDDTTPTWGAFCIDPATTVIQSSASSIEMDGYLYTGATAGSFTLQWAQAASNVTATNVNANTYLTLWRVG